MKILHTSDWHLGKVLYERSLIEDQKHALIQINEIIKNNRYDVLLIAGDIYDRSIPSIEAVELFSWFLTDLRRISNIPVCIIPGNHDSAVRLSYCSELMAVSNIYIQTDQEKIFQPVHIHTDDFSADIYMIPFLNPSAYNIHSVDEEPVPATHESAVTEAVNKIKENINPNNINILIGHLLTRGGMTSESERRFIGSLGDIDPAIINGFDYTALGHLHRSQSINDRTYYSGSLLKYSFSECNEKKQILSIELNKGSIEIEPIEIKPLRDMFTLKGKYKELMYDDTFLDYKDHFIEAELIDGDLVINPISTLRDRFPHILSVKQNYLEKNVSQNQIEIVNIERNIENDFISFHNYIYNENPCSEKLKIFREIQSDSIPL